MTINLNINISNKVGYILISLLFITLLVGAGYAYTQAIPNPGHGGDTIWVTIGGVEKTLQQALDMGFLETTYVAGPCVTNQVDSYATCPAGYKLTGGGSLMCESLGCPGDPLFAFKRKSYPSGNSWIANDNACGVQAYAVCTKII
jgi:hypothetical protein